MNTYRIKIRLENGDEIKAQSVGNTPQEAEAKVFEDVEFRKFVGDLKIESVHTQIEQTNTLLQVDATRYDFRPSQEHEGWYVVTDKKDMVVVIFEKGRFNETKRVTRLDDTLPDPLTAASGLRAIVDYLMVYHLEVL